MDISKQLVDHIRVNLPVGRIYCEAVEVSGGESFIGTNSLSKHSLSHSGKGDLGASSSGMAIVACVSTSSIIPIASLVAEPCAPLHHSYVPDPYPDKGDLGASSLGVVIVACEPASPLFMRLCWIRSPVC